MLSSLARLPFIDVLTVLDDVREQSTTLFLWVCRISSANPASCIKYSNL